jgi:hypothetical protein
MPTDNETTKPGLKVVAIAVSAVLVAALAATGVLAYGQNSTSNTTTLEETNSTDTASNNMTETTTSSSESDDTGEQDEETFTASAVADSECSSVFTTEGAVSLNSTMTMTAEEISEEAGTMTAGLDDSQIASLDQLIENACDAIREGKSVTALGHLQAARDVLSTASEIEEEEPEDES